MKRRYIYGFALLIAASLYSCKKKDPSVDDLFINYTVPDVPATKNYVVGAFYYQFGSFNTITPQKPVVGGPGPYCYFNGNPVLGATSSAASIPAPAVMDAHVADAAIAKIDYFVFSVRSPTMDNNNFKVDSNTIVSFLNAANSSKMNFAISYNLNTGTLGINATSTTAFLEANATKLLGFYNDFKRLSYWMTKANYQKVNGKYIIIINNAQDLNSSNNVALYKQLRTNLSALGFDLFIVGMQGRWSPPQRYYYRFQNCTDAMYEANMGDYAGDLDRYYEFPQFCDQNWAYWKTTVEGWGQQFVPCVMAGYNYQYQGNTGANNSVQRTADGAWYKKFTDVAKRNASSLGLVFVDSFNNFTTDSQIEPTQAYGNTYLDITRTAFKVN
ncbi:MAG: hypothetical protein V4592_17720 [Bacteroidota bacterium]